ncbi:hypothetical protein CERSUDRAFT_122305 [Gelatoporia subvermispora B]|uniref:Telomere-associated protein Rif1 N-terminal domain-containing protein n=1 Tax=Ceriporiopsis subvermispora (strain B) TaxID=914234 RepID=M2RN05_CERS8|nr:hypothetical protein CERSUDRAFT_122305 [Gelatoporia subvermispora B]
MSLPTPPGTTHKHTGKENRTRRLSVVWSEEHQYHTITSSPSPISRSGIDFSVPKGVPTKSILKKTSYDALPLLDATQKEATPEPADPLVDLRYLEGPVNTIINEDASLRDLIEAYSILGARLRASVVGSTDADASWPLFQPLRVNRKAFVRAVARDLGRALIDPEATGPDAQAAEAREEAACSLPSPKGSPRKKKGVSGEQVKYARDLCTTSHAVIKLLYTVFGLPAVYQVFTDEQLRFMLTQVLAIPLANELPTPNARKTCALAIWLIQSLRLPSEVLEPAADRIAYALQRAVEGELGKEGKKGSTSDGLKAVHDLATAYPSVFVPAFGPLLESILSNLLAPTLALRSQACHALGGLALGLSTLTAPSAVHLQYSETIAMHIQTSDEKSNASPNKRSPGSVQNNSPLYRTLRTTLQATEPKHAAQGPVWAWCVLASFVVMLGTSLFVEEQVTRAMIALLKVGMRHRRSSVRALGSVVWRSIAWAYFQPLPCEYVKEPEDNDEEMRMWYEEQMRRSYTLVPSVVDMGAGMATIAVLLAGERTSDEALKRALAVLGTMSRKGGQSCKDALDIACQLVGLNNANEWNMQKLLPVGLFDANPGLLTAEYKSLPAMVRQIIEQCPQLDDVRSLTIEEMSTEWVLEDMLAVWREGLNNLRLAWDCEIPSEIIDIWYGLLRANVSVLQGSTPLTTIVLENSSQSTDGENEDGVVRFAHQAVEVLIDLLCDFTLDISMVRGNPDESTSASPLRPTPKASRKPESSRCNLGLKLVLARDLWTVMKTAFSREALESPAQKLLAFLVEQDKELVGNGHHADEVRRQWACLCAEVVSYCDVESLQAFWGGKGERQMELRARSWSDPVRPMDHMRRDLGDGSRDLGDRNSWEMSNNDLEVWDTFLRSTMDRALDFGIDSVAVIDQVACILSANHSPTASMTTRIADLLLSHLDINDAREIPTGVLGFVNDTLVATYPPEPRNIITSTWLMRSLTRVIDACPIELALSMFELVQEGLSLWISDQYKTFSEEEYGMDVSTVLQSPITALKLTNLHQILPVYQTVLLGISSLDRSASVLDALTTIIESGFRGRPDKPTAVADAFADFWQENYAAVEAPSEGWPDQILNCLRAIRVGQEAVELGTSPEISECGSDSTAVGTHYADDTTDDACDEEEEEVCKVLLSPTESPLLEPAFTFSVPTSPLVRPTEPEIIRPQTPERRSTREPERPRKPCVAPFLLPPSSVSPPSSPLRPPRTPQRTPRRHESSSARRRSLDNKENQSPLPVIASVAERIAASASPSGLLSLSPVLGKRSLDEWDQDEQPAKRHRPNVSPAFSRGVLQTLSGGSPEDPHSDPDLDATPTPSTIRPEKRKGNFVEAVEVPTLREVLRMEREESQSTPPPVHGKRPRKSLRRTRSSAKSMGEPEPSEQLETPTKRRKSSPPQQKVELPEACFEARRESSSPLRALRQHPVIDSDDSVMLASPHDDVLSDLPPSDDDPHYGQVTPRRIISPAMRRVKDGDFDVADSDDSNVPSSPLRDHVARRLARQPSLPKMTPLTLSLRASGRATQFWTHNMPSLPALHYDVLREICEHLRLDIQGRVGLARAAQANKVLSEAALDVLWQNLDTGLLPLVRLLSTSSEEREYPDSSAYANQSLSWDNFPKTFHVVVLDTPILPDQWRRFQFYARRVRSMSYRENTAFIDPSVLYALGHHALPEPIIPHLRALSWTQHLLHGGELLQFISPNLYDISLTVHDNFGPREAPVAMGLFARSDDSNDHLLLSAIHSRAPHIRRIELFGWPIQAPLEDLSDFQHLREVTLGRYYNDTNQYLLLLSTFPNLKALTLDLPVARHPGLVVTEDFGSGSCCDPPLSLLKQRWMSSMRELFLSLSAPNSPVIDHHFSDFNHVLIHLLPLSRLRKVHIDLRHVETLAPLTDDVIAIASAWPELEELAMLVKFVDSRGNRRRCVFAPSIYSLIPLALKCPRLRSLALSCVDLRPQGLPTDILAGLQHRLTSLEVEEVIPKGHAALIDPAAQFLRNLFPDARLLSSGHDEFGRVVKAWKRARAQTLIGGK